MGGGGAEGSELKGHVRAQGWAPSLNLPEATISAGLRDEPSLASWTLGLIEQGFSSALTSSNLQGKHDWLQSGRRYRNINAVFFYVGNETYARIFILGINMLTFSGRCEGCRILGSKCMSSTCQLPTSPVCKKLSFGRYLCNMQHFNQQPHEIFHLEKMADPCSSPR